MIGMGLGNGIGRSMWGASIWTPADLFSGQEGFWFAPNPSTCFTDTGRTTAAGVGDAVAAITDLSGNGNHATQSTVSQRPILRQSGALYYLEFDGVDDAMATGTVDATAENTVVLSAGVRNVDTTAGGEGTVINQNGADYNSFGLRVPSNTTNNVRLVAFGDNPGGSTSLFVAGQPNTLDAVVTGRVDLNATDNYLRVNGTVGATGGTAGAGEYSNGVIGVGARSTGSPIFTGDMTGLFCRFGDDLTTQELSDLENYLATLTGVSL